jgi:hypothetical protein
MQSILMHAIPAWYIITHDGRIIIMHNKYPDGIHAAQMRMHAMAGHKGLK